MNRLAAALLTFALLLILPSAFADAGMDSEAVKKLQLDLIAAGYLDGDADGVPGQVTFNAICAAQLDLGLPVDGQMSVELSAALCRDAFPLRRESRGSLVYELQERLYDWGFLEDAPTGYFGSATEAATIDLQALAREDFAAWMQRRSDAELAALDAPADVAIDLPLYRAEDVPCDGAMTADWYRFLFEEFHFDWATAEPGERSERAKLVQKRLHALGYLYRVDGVYGGGTELAMKYFQRRNGLPQTGACDAATGSVLFSRDAVRSDEYVMPYMAYVARGQSRVYILGWDGEGYNERVAAFKCSCGKRSTPTVSGTFYCEGPVADWYYMEHSKVWVRYAYKIQGNYFFHSVLFRNRGDHSPTSNSKSALGSNVSNGCIRLAGEDIQWIYENCPSGMKVVIE